MSDKVKIKGGFTAVPNYVLRDNRLKLEDRGLLALIASHSGDWEFRKQDMMEKCNCGEARYYSMIERLKAAGYLQIVPRDKHNGRFSGSDWIVDFLPHPEKPCAENRGLPHPEKPRVENPCDKNNKNKNTNKNTPLTPQGGISLSDFFEAWGGTEDHGTCKRYWQGLGPEERVAALEGIGSWPEKEKAKTYLHQKRWLEKPEVKSPDLICGLHPKTVESIQDGSLRPFMLPTLKDSQIAALIAENHVTADQCRSVGIRI